MEEFAQEIVCLFRQYRECCAHVERQQEGQRVKEKLERICESSRQRMNIAEPKLLLALMDAYEITRDEGMLQEVLDVVSANVERLEVSEVSVRLLAYCYYYVEEEECMERAREMVEKLKKEGKDTVEVEKVLEELA